MLAKRLIACLDVRNGCVVKGVQFQDLATAGEPAALARRYNAEGIDELVILDVTATVENRRALAATLRAVSAELSAVRSCRTCAIGAPLPRGAYDGGDCCAGGTADLFDDNELAALAHAGTRPRDLVAPPGTDAHAGCAFRGPRGCTLDVTHRPGRCVHYLCDTLRRELHAGDKLDVVEAKLAAPQYNVEIMVVAAK
jgi:hypothetical protein